MRSCRLTEKRHGNSGTRRIGCGNGFGLSCRTARSANELFASMCIAGRWCWGSWTGKLAFHKAMPGASKRRSIGTSRMPIYPENESSRSMASGAAFHYAYLHATQQAFLEAHELAFAYFGGVFRKLRYDNLTSAVKKILRGSRREETARFVAFRSHWRFEAEFCTPGEPHEKGGMEGEAGYFRRNH